MADMTSKPSASQRGSPASWTKQQQDDATALLRGTLMGDVKSLEAERDQLRARVKAREDALTQIVAKADLGARILESNRPEIAAGFLVIANYARAALTGGTDAG